jgi:hypothetical protein
MNPHDHPKWDQWAAAGMSEDEMRDLIAAEELSIDLSGVVASWEVEGYNPQEEFFDTIIGKANSGIVTADDFRRFIGCTNWMMADDEVCKFIVRRVFDNGRVEIIVGMGPNYRIFKSIYNGVAWHIDADELAIRMEAA